MKSTVLTEFILKSRSRGSNFFLAFMVLFRCYPWSIIDYVYLWDLSEELPKSAEAVIVVVSSVAQLRVEVICGILVLFPNLSPVENLQPRDFELTVPDIIWAFRRASIRYLRYIRIWFTFLRYTCLSFT